MRRCLHFLATVLILCAGVPAAAQEEPYPPCDGEPEPFHASLGEPPNLMVVTQEGFVWDAPHCTGWGKGKYALLLAVSARFEHRGGVTALIGKLAAASQLAKVRYWSISRQAWRPLFGAAHALSQANPEARRTDFPPDRLVPGPVHHVWLEESGPVGGAVFRIRVLDRSRHRLVVDIRNEHAVNPPLHPRIAAGAYRHLFFFDRERPGVWRYYGLSGLRGAGGSAITWIRSSYLNRTVALFRYLTGMPMEQEPPAAR